MSNLFIYLAGPIAGCTKGEANDWRKAVKKEFVQGIVGVSPLRCETLIGRKYKLGFDDPRFGTSKAIAGKNWFDLGMCDMVLAYLPKELNDKRPSWGTAFEIGAAIEARKPIILVTDDKKLFDHPIAKARIDWIFPDFEPAIETINGLLEVYT